MAEQQLTDVINTALAGLSKPIDPRLAGPAVLSAIDGDPAATHRVSGVYIRFPATDTCRVICDQLDVTVVA